MSGGRVGAAVGVGTRSCEAGAVEACAWNAAGRRRDGREGFGGCPGLLAAAMAAIVVLVSPTVAQARAVKIQVTGVQNPTFGGTSFGAVGQYEKIRGTFTGLVDPGDPKN